MAAQLPHLEIPDGDAGPDTVNDFLASLGAAAATLTADVAGGLRTMNVFPKELCYKGDWERSRAPVPQTRVEGGEGLTERQKKSALSVYGLVQEGVKCYRSPTNGARTYYLIASAPRLVWANSYACRQLEAQGLGGGDAEHDQARGRHLEGMAEWHVMGVCFHEGGDIYVYDPSYPAHEEAGVRRRLGNISFGHLVRELIGALEKKGTAVRTASIFYGGGGNVAGECRDMTARWLRDEVYDALMPPGAPRRHRDWVAGTGAGGGWSAVDR